MRKEKIPKGQVVGTLNKHNCNVPLASEELHITRSGIYWLLKEYGLKIVKEKKLVSVKENA